MFLQHFLVFHPLCCAGADVQAVDLVQGKGLKDWVLRTGRFETLNRIRRLQGRSVAEQFCESYKPEWPELKQLVEKTTAPKSTSQKLRQRLKESFTFSFPHDPQDNGVMDHMVRITTSIHSPLIATGTRPLCPSSPPEIGKRRFAVPELLEKHSSKELEESTVSHTKGFITSASSTVLSTTSVSLTSCCHETERRASMPSGGVRSFIPRSMAHRNSIFPSGCIPKIEVTKSGEPTPKKEKKKKRQKGYLEPPVWKYKEAKEEKKREKKRQEQEKEEEKKSKGSKKSSSKHWASQIKFHCDMARHKINKISEITVTLISVTWEKIIAKELWERWSDKSRELIWTLVQIETMIHWNDSHKMLLRILFFFRLWA